MDGKTFNKATSIEVRMGDAGPTATMEMFWDEGLDLDGYFIPEYGLPAGVRIPLALKLKADFYAPKAHVKIDGEEYRAWDVVAKFTAEDKTHLIFTVQMGDRPIRIAGHLWGIKELDSDEAAA